MPFLVATFLASVLTLASDGPQQAAIVPDELLGPYALLVASLLAVAVLWRTTVTQQKAIVELSGQAGRVPDLVARAERAEGLADVAVGGWREQTTASGKSAEAIETISRQLEVRPPARRRS